MEAHDLTDRSAESQAVVERAVEALQVWDLESYAALLADDITWQGMGMDYMPNGGLFEGKEAVLGDLGLTVQSIYDTSSFKFDVKSVTAAGDTVIMEWVVDAKTAYGRPYQNVYCVVFVVENGLISAMREYTDTRYAKALLFP